MRFFNRYILLFGAIITVLTAIFYAVLIYLLGEQQYIGVGALCVFYGLGMFFAGRIIGRRDIYAGNIGFNYHLMTYLVCVSAAWITQLAFDHTSGALSMTLTWGIGITIHFFMWLSMRKKNVRGFDKDEIFE